MSTTEKAASSPPRIWPAQIVAMCGEMMNCIATLRSGEKLGALKATDLERDEIATELEKVGRAAYILAADFRKGAK